MTCITGSTFAYASAQAVCAVSVCSEASSHSNIAMILDASLLLASIIILPIILLVLLVLRFKTESHRISVQRAHSSLALQAA